VAALVGVTTRGEDTLAAATTGLARAAGTGQASGRPAMMWILARIHQELGREKEALELVDAALPMAAAGRQAFFDAELLRTRGELLLSRDETKAESVLLRALELACEQGALSFELRSATSLARAWRDRHREEDARGLLAPVYARFTQGFDTLDLREARRLLAELA
jgi:predicted ATPase